MHPIRWYSLTLDRQASENSEATPEVALDAGPMAIEMPEIQSSGSIKHLWPLSIVSIARVAKHPGVIVLDQKLLEGFS